MNSIMKEVINFVNENDIKFIRLAFCDIFGTQKNVAIMSNELEHAFENGILIDAFAIDGFENEINSQIRLFPDPSTISILPWRPSEGRVARFFCNIKYPDGKVFEYDSRYILDKAVQKAKDMGFNTKVGADCEFYIFETDDEGHPTLIPYDDGGYLDVSPVDQGENIRREICLTLEEMGISPISSCHERGPGQHRVKFQYGDPIAAAENFMTFKWIVKAIAAKNGGYATFMPKPIKELSGSGLHLNFQLFKNGKNILSEGIDKSPEMKNFMAGIINRINDITAILNPTRNSYSRFGEFNAPKHINWSEKNPNTLIKIVDYTGKHAEIKVRSVDPTTNPYLAIATILLAGLNGIENNETLDENIHLTSILDKYVSEDDPTLPLDFETAINLFEQSEFAKEAIGDNIKANFIKWSKDSLKIDEDVSHLKRFLID